MNEQIIQNLVVPVGGFVLFVLTAVFLRPMGRRTAGALGGGLAGVGIALTLDPVGYKLGFWHYTGDYLTHANYPAYVGVALALAALNLIGWRIARQFGTGFCVAFILVAALTAMFYDNVLGIQVLSQTLGVIPFFADAILWTTVVGMAYLVMRAVSGAAEADRLRVAQSSMSTSATSSSIRR